MKAVKIGIMVLIIVTMILGSCTPEAEKAGPSLVFDNEDHFIDLYEYTLAGLGQKDIITSVNESGTVAEYRVVEDISFVGLYYYSLQIFKDGTGKFTFIVHHGDQFNEYGELLLNKSQDISKDDTDILQKAIGDNLFWNMATYQNDKNATFLDGKAILIEGYYNGKTHIAHMGSPGKEYGIYKILKAFDDYSVNIAENPLKEKEIEYDSY